MKLRFFVLCFSLLVSDIFVQISHSQSEEALERLEKQIIKVQERKKMLYAYIQSLDETTYSPLQLENLALVSQTGSFFDELTKRTSEPSETIENAGLQTSQIMPLTETSEDNPEGTLTQTGEIKTEITTISALMTQPTEPKFKEPIVEITEESDADVKPAQQITSSPFIEPIDTFHETTTIAKDKSELGSFDESTDEPTAVVTEKTEHEATQRNKYTWMPTTTDSSSYTINRTESGTITTLKTKIVPTAVPTTEELITVVKEEIVTDRSTQKITSVLVTEPIDTFPDTTTKATQKSETERVIESTDEPTTVLTKKTETDAPAQTNSIPDIVITDSSNIKTTTGKTESENTKISDSTGFKPTIIVTESRLIDLDSTTKSILNIITSNLATDKPESITGSTSLSTALNNQDLTAITSEHDLFTHEIGSESSLFDITITAETERVTSTDRFTWMPKTEKTEPTAPKTTSTHSEISISTTQSSDPIPFTQQSESISMVTSTSQSNTPTIGAIILSTTETMQQSTIVSTPSLSEIEIFTTDNPTESISTINTITDSGLTTTISTTIGYEDNSKMVTNETEISTERSTFPSMGTNNDSITTTTESGNWKTETEKSTVITQTTIDLISSSTELTNQESMKTESQTVHNTTSSITQSTLSSTTETTNQLITILSSSTTTTGEDLTSSTQHQTTEPTITSTTLASSTIGSYETVPTRVPEIQTTTQDSLAFNSQSTDISEKDETTTHPAIDATSSLTNLKSCDCGKTFNQLADCRSICTSSTFLGGFHNNLTFLCLKVAMIFSDRDYLIYLGIGLGFVVLLAGSVLRVVHIKKKRKLIAKRHFDILYQDFGLAKNVDQFTYQSSIL